MKVQPKTENQKILLSALYKNDVIFIDGPSGTGKSYCTIGYAVNSFFQKNIQKILMVKPLVQCGNEIAALPGDLTEKTSIYFDSLLQTVLEFVGDKKVLNKMLENKEIELLPLAFWRGYTFKNTFILVDEAQSLSLAQLKLAVSRIGQGSKMVFCGDINQSDLFRSDSPFEKCLNHLPGINNLEVVHLDKSDILRHNIIGEILTRIEEKF